MQPLDQTEEKDEFLYPGDVWSGFLGKAYKEKLDDFLKKGISESQFKNMKIIDDEIYTFLEWKQKNSPIAYEAILEDVEADDERHLSFVTGFPFLEGKKQKMEITCIRDHEDNNRLEGYIGLSFVEDAQDLLAYNPCFALQRSVFSHIKPNKKKQHFANVCVAGLALSIKKSPRKIIKVNKGGFYEVSLKEFLEKNPDKTQADFPYAKVDASHMSALFHKAIKDEYEFVSDIYSVKKFKFNDMEFYQLEIEVLRNIETDKGMKIFLYVNKELLGKYEPKVKDNIHGLMQLTAYLDEKECSKILEASKEDAEIITSNGRVKYKVEIPLTDDEHSNGLAFRDSLKEQTGMLYVRDCYTTSMFTPQTKLPVDFIFTDLCGNILKIARDVEPLSYESHKCKNCRAVLEINKGEADKLGIKEGDILVHRFLYPPKKYGQLTVKDADCYYRYGRDLYAEKNGILHLYSYKSHVWFDEKSTRQRKELTMRIANCIKMGIPKIEITAAEAERLMNEYENELHSDYATSLKRYYRAGEKLFYSHDEINDIYKLYSFEKGWINMHWIRNEHRELVLNKAKAQRITSKEVENLIDEYRFEVERHNFQEDIDNLADLMYYEGGSPHWEFYIAPDNTLWRMFEKKNEYQTFDPAKNYWSAHLEKKKTKKEIERAKQGKKIDFIEAIEKCKEQAKSYRRKNNPHEKMATVSLWVNMESEKAIEIEEEFLYKLAKAYNTYDCSELEKYLADDVTYDSTWVLDQLKSKTQYLDYLRGKLNTMNRTGTKTNFVMMHKRNHGKPVLMVSPEIPEGGYGAFTAEADENGLIKAVHITPASFYAPLICKDEEKYQQFIKISEESKK